MSQPYIGEIRMFAGNYAPAGWMFCEGQLLPISENEVFFSLIGTTYGGDGQTSFALPDLRGRIPVHQGSGFILAETGGAEEVTLTVSQITNHSHLLLVSNNTATARSPQGGVMGTATADVYASSAANTNMSAQAVGAAGGSQPHANFQPYLCVNFIIALFGIYPSPT